MAPPGPRLCPWTFHGYVCPSSLGPSLHDVPSDDGVVCTCGTIDDWEQFRYGFRHVSPSRPIHTRRRTLSYGSRLMFLPRSHKHQDRLRDDFEENPTPLRPLGDFTTSRSALSRAPRDHSYRDLGFLHSRCDQLSLALAESCWGGRSPVIASSRVALCHPRPDSSSLKIVFVQETSPAILLLKSLFKQRYHEPFVPGALYSDNRRLRSRESPSP